MHTYFYELADFLNARLRGDEVFTCRFSGEDSDFVRFNGNAVRHAIHVTQSSLRMELIEGRRHARADVTLSGDQDMDHARLVGVMEQLREQVAHVPEDPFLLYNSEVRSTERHAPNRLPPPAHAVEEIIAQGAGTDLVGILACGGIFKGFANSLGQRNWMSSYSHNFDWSLYHVRDKAVKSDYAGFTWDSVQFNRKMTAAKHQLKILARTPRTLTPGRYRVYLSPVALSSFLEMLAWGGFGMKDHRTRQTPLIRMVEEDARLHPSITVLENTREGVAADFQDEGFIKPDIVPIIEKGAFRGCLTSPRSAQEYGVPTNGASESEQPESVDMSGGSLEQDDVLKALGTGLYVNNLWYLNFSDRPACRITGMTRFATFWVEGGEIVAPINVMRFDETVYRVLGDNLVALTAERDLLLDSYTYTNRSTSSGRLPGALVEDFAFTL
ncbi:MAG: TldE/PmbA family protein [Armatimonadetes bacterium]|nr:TldE/PmbA family protein [Armatimonadota bacterium]